MRLNLGDRANAVVPQRVALRNSLHLVTFLVGSIPRFLSMDIRSHPRAVIDDSLRGRTPKLNLGGRYPLYGEFNRSLWQDAGDRTNYICTEMSGMTSGSWSNLVGFLNLRARL